MSLKMNKLVELSGVPKATILYYIKEGILPQPDKPKPNLHLYDEETLERLDFIKYLQKNFNCTINEIKTVLENQKIHNTSNYEALLDAIEIVMGNRDQTHYTKEEAARYLGMEESFLDELLDEGIVFMRDGVLSQKELEIVQIVMEYHSLNLDIELFKTYAHHARELATLEVAMSQKLLNKESKKATIKRLFDTLLILKPYIFNMTTLKEYQGASHVRDTQN
ncbi:MAG: hypothetical protein KU38_08775 [Sulfurovum sp. FS08-3]|nr:MAG: hypothetical protein KU38_08775 [Sulfurovum sp. FS08-3]